MKNKTKLGPVLKKVQGLTLRQMPNGTVGIYAGKNLYTPVKDLDAAEFLAERVFSEQYHHRKYRLPFLNWQKTRKYVK